MNRNESLMTYPGPKSSPDTEQILAMIPFELLKSSLSEGRFGLSEEEIDEVLNWYRRRIHTMKKEGILEDSTELLTTYLEEIQPIAT